jgi:NAD(P)-dependent dehydrogenase (short-subunit alcohol dehydrogenase family)
VGTLDPVDLGRHLALNLVAPMVLCNAFVRETRSLAGARRIVNISSGSGRRAYAGWAAYCAGKAALDHFSRTLALEQQAQRNGARVVALAPGILDTAMQATVRAQGADRFPDVERFRELARSGSLVAPAAAARRIAAFLCADGFGAQPVADLREMAA